jgi:hypothetical protein
MRISDRIKYQRWKWKRNTNGVAWIDWYIPHASTFHWISLLILNIFSFLIEYVIHSSLIKIDTSCVHLMVEIVMRILLLKIFSHIIPFHAYFIKILILWKFVRDLSVWNPNGNNFSSKIDYGNDIQLTC